MVYLFLIFLIIISGSSFFAIKFNKKIENNDIIEIENINGNVKFQNISK